MGPGKAFGEYNTSYVEQQNTGMTQQPHMHTGTGVPITTIKSRSQSKSPGKKKIILEEVMPPPHSLTRGVAPRAPQQAVPQQAQPAHVSSLARPLALGAPAAVRTGPWVVLRRPRLRAATEVAAAWPGAVRVLGEGEVWVMLEVRVVRPAQAAVGSHANLRERQPQRTVLVEAVLR